MKNKTNKEIKYTLKSFYKTIEEAERVNCNIEFSPKVLRTLLAQQNQETIKELIVDLRYCTENKEDYKRVLKYLKAKLNIL